MTADARLHMQKQDRDLEADDRVLVARNDLTGMLAIFIFGKKVYWRLLTSLALIVAATACVMFAARMLGLLVEAVSYRASPQLVAKYAAVFLLLEGLNIVGQYFGRLNLAKATIDVTYHIRRELFSKMRKVPIAYFDSQPLGRTITRLTGDVEGIESFFGGTMARVLTAFITVMVVLVAMVVTDPVFGSVIVAASLPSLVFSIAMRKPVRNSLRSYKRHAAHVNAKLAENLSGMPIIRIFGLEGWTHRIYSEATQAMFKAGVRTANLNSFIRPMTVLLCSLPTLLILWKGGERVITGVMSLGTLIAYVRYSERFIAPIRTISQEIQNIQEALVSSERVRRMLGEPEEDQALGEAGSYGEVLRGSVEYQDVWMSYAAGREVLRGISFKAEPGMKIGLVGASGSGKTTTVNLLPQLYPISRGRILIDGTDIRQFTREALRSQIGYVGQDVVIVSGSVRDNLVMTLTGPVPTDSIIWQACRKSGLAEVLVSLPAGLNHQLIEGGENLSMGERQLIAFTRMILRDPRIMILDEATANIDERCERLVQRAIDETMQGRTCFVIAHRLSTIVRCDLILVFSGGQIVESGTHAELLARHGVYARLASQSGGGQL